MEVVSSAELIQAFEAKWTAEQLESHLEAGKRVDRVRQSAFEYLQARLRAAGRLTTELDVKRFVLDGIPEGGYGNGPWADRLGERECVEPALRTDGESHSPIHDGDLVLLDLWAKLDQPEAVYYDITWTGFAATIRATRCAACSPPCAIAVQGTVSR